MEEEASAEVVADSVEAVVASEVAVADSVEAAVVSVAAEEEEEDKMSSVEYLPF